MGHDNGRQSGSPCGDPITLLSFSVRQCHCERSILSIHCGQNGVDACFVEGRAVNAKPLNLDAAAVQESLVPRASGLEWTACQTAGHRF
jgi:hypothetical protein